MDRPPSTTRRAVLAGAGALLTLLSGCTGGPRDGRESPTPSPAPTASPSPTSAPERERRLELLVDKNTDGLATVRLTLSVRGGEPVYDDTLELDGNREIPRYVTVRQGASYTLEAAVGDAKRTQSSFRIDPSVAGLFVTILDDDIDCGAVYVD